MRGPHWSGPPCPQDPAHGRLLDWPNDRAGWYCPNVKHTGSSFYTTDLVPTSRAAADSRLPSRSTSAPAQAVRTPSGRTA